MATKRQEEALRKKMRLRRKESFGSLTVEEAYSKFDIDSNILTSTTVVFKGSNASKLPAKHVIFHSGGDINVANNREFLLLSRHLNTLK